MRSNIISHSNAKLVIPKDIQYEIVEIVDALKSPIESNGATTIRKEIIEDLHQLGWSNPIKLDVTSNMSITGVKNKVGICVQLGNISRIYADLIKMQTLFIRQSIIGGVIILPTNTTAGIMGQNMANSDRLSRELKIYYTVITIPLLIVGFSE